MCCAAAGVPPAAGWDWAAGGAHAVVHAALQQQQYEDGLQAQGAVYEEVMEPVAEVEPRLSSFGWKSEATRGSRRSRTDSRCQVWPRHGIGVSLRMLDARTLDVLG